MEQLKKAKAQCLADLTEALPRYRDRLTAIDDRLTAYIDDALSSEASHANLYELLGIRKVLRLMDSYELNGERVQMTIRAIEGQWKNGKHLKGGLKFDTPRGHMHVRLMAYQVWSLFGIYGFLTEVDMECDYHEGDELLPSEFVRDGRVWDKRRLCTEAHIFQTRKSGKTEWGGAVDFVEATILGPANAQVLICANSRDQAKIAYKAIKQFAAQVDPSCLNRMGGKYFRLTADEMNWQPGHKRTGEIKVMSAGGKTKDGLYGSVVHADEHGQSGYVNNSSDMQRLVEVCWGSTGPRREKLLLHTTTAGLVTEGPYKNQLTMVQQSLMTELQHPLGKPCRTMDDKWFAFLLQLDPWEQDYTLEQLDNPDLFHKVNRSIGTTVQPTYYRERLHDASLNEDTKKEVLTKDFNIWQTGKIEQWIKGDKIRPLQIERRVSDCLFEEGWNTFVGFDFGGIDDLFAITTLSVNYKEGLEMHDRFFADTVAWITEAAYEESPNRKLYDLWIEKEWLKLCPGEVFQPSLAVNEFMELTQKGINVAMLGYDPAQSRDPVNTISAWLQSLGIYPENIKNMLIPVQQNAMTMNQVVQRIEYMVLNTDPWMRFSMSPLWPWCFQNCGVEIGRTDLRRVLKGGKQHEKIDCVAALLDALYCFDFSEGQIGK
ncbi:MAG: hypothetical protein IJR87_00680 [Bacteroidaceae bacterium]|nr:hypothetical protein [Bacteroidaceae bacterium]